MNAEQIREMDAGRVLDALVAILVFGREMCPVHQNLFCCGRGGGRYSTDIAAAWEVVEKLIAGEYEISMATREDREGTSYWGVDFYTMIDEAALDACFSADASTVPLAICRAALLAVMEEES